MALWCRNYLVVHDCFQGVAKYLLEFPVQQTLSVFCEDTQIPNKSLLYVITCYLDTMILELQLSIDVGRIAVKDHSDK